MGYEARIELTDATRHRWRGGHRPDHVDLSTLFRHLTELDATALEAASDGAASPQEAWRAVLPTGAQLVSLLGRHAAWIRVPQAPISPELVVKVVPPRSSGGALAWAARERSRAHRAHLWAHRLRAFGVATPRPLGWLERARGARRHVSFVVSEWVDAPTLHSVVEGGLSVPKKRALIRRVADTLRTMHSQGVFHGDLHAENLLIDDDAVLVIDLESMRSIAFPGRAVERNLVRLNRAFLDPARITLTDRMRFLRDYLRTAPDAHAQTRQLFGDVLAETRSKLAERGERFVSTTDDAPTLPPG